jgi:hypothetical protein
MLCSRGGEPMLARIAVMKALNLHVERVFNPDRKDTHWGNGSSRGINDRSRIVRWFPASHRLGCGARFGAGDQTPKPKSENK